MLVSNTLIFRQSECGTVRALCEPPKPARLLHGSPVTLVSTFRDEWLAKGGGEMALSSRGHNGVNVQSAWRHTKKRLAAHEFLAPGFDCR